MSQPDHATILHRIEALLRQAKGTTFEAEARAARAKARELMQRYGISSTELKPKAPKAPAAARRQPGSRTSPPPMPVEDSPAATPVTIRIDIGGMRIRWRL